MWKNIGAMVFAIAISTPMLAWGTIQTGKFPMPHDDKTQQEQHLGVFEYCATVGMVAQSITQAKNQHEASWEQIQPILESKIHPDAMQRLKNAYSTEWKSPSQARDVTREQCVTDWKQ